MSEGAAAIGSIGWCDLTVPDAGAVREFYESVVGWTSAEHDMGGYADYVMTRADGTGTSGICWARGANAGLPPVWLVYFVVPSLDESLAQVRARGGSVLREPAAGGAGRYAVIRDPAGAICALYQS
ncbi:MAG TPA: VOC family protein [Candidatus Polarisedimenticolaceae bacterium]|nr:VOC family protein [Candidatus Polarisedimenticolaceae bacterium]